MKVIEWIVYIPDKPLHLHVYAQSIHLYCRGEYYL